jgi:hypothetical protein
VFTAAVANAGSGFSPVGITIGGNTLTLDYNGVGGTGPIASIIDVSAVSNAAPEPATLATLGLALAGLGLCRRRLAASGGRIGGAG